MTWYCVIYIGSHRKVYLGTCEDQCAEHLDPGTCYGKGESAHDAESAAVASALRLKRGAGYKQTDEPWRKYSYPKNTASRIAAERN